MWISLHDREIIINHKNGEPSPVRQKKKSEQATSRLFEYPIFKIRPA